jgi:hypothetical protein
MDTAPRAPRPILALILAVALVACTPAATPTAPLPPTATRPPTPTLTPLQATAEAVRRQQQAQRVQTAQATATIACDRLRTFYAEKGQPFDPLLAATDPQRMLIELRIMSWGTGDQPRSVFASSVDDAWQGYIDDCGGR